MWRVWKGVFANRKFEISPCNSYKSKRFECGECENRFVNRSDLISHQRIHTEETPYKCPDCPKRFKRTSDLRKHERTHSGEKPHECGECRKGFNQLDP